jgi:hypothetical protein
LRVSVCIILSAFLVGASWAADPFDMVFISEVLYDPGSGSFPPFIEFYNASKVNVDLTGWRVLIYGKNGLERATLSNDMSKVIIPSHGFYLVGRAKDRDAWSKLSYKPDFYCDLSMNFASGEGGVVLERPGGQRRDAVGWGPVRWPYYEVNGNSYDTGDNLNDFRDRAKPQPQNINSPRESPAANTEGNAWGRIKAMYYGQ